MNQSTRKQFHPPALFTNCAARSATDQALYIQLESWFNKREIARSQTYRHFPVEDAAEQRLHEIDQVCNRNIPIHHHAFELIKRVFVRCVYFFIPEYTPR